MVHLPSLDVFGRQNLVPSFANTISPEVLSHKAKVGLKTRRMMPKGV
mgnify:CR=1 FL=1